MGIKSNLVENWSFEVEIFETVASCFRQLEQRQIDLNTIEEITDYSVEDIDDFVCLGYKNPLESVMESGFFLVLEACKCLGLGAIQISEQPVSFHTKANLGKLYKLFLSDANCLFYVMDETARDLVVLAEDHKPDRVSGENYDLVHELLNDMTRSVEECHEKMESSEETFPIEVEFDFYNRTVTDMWTPDKRPWQERLSSSDAKQPAEEAAAAETS